MDLFGIGTLELLVVLLVALLVLGPARMVDVARSLGKFWREAQVTLRQAADMATVKLDEPLNLAVPRDPIDQPEESISRGDQPNKEPPKADGAEPPMASQAPLPGLEAPRQQPAEPEEKAG